MGRGLWRRGIPASLRRDERENSETAGCLGAGVVPESTPRARLPDRVRLPEFTCVCPRTGQPDFATIRIEYVPDQVCVELKSLKLYLWSFRDVGAFHEKVTNDLCDALVALLRPRRLSVVGDFRVRGGITTRVECRHPA
jgi:7-cyano-7-deazaguanine reductase